MSSITRTRRAARGLAIAGAAVGVLAGCGDGSGSSSQTTFALTSTNYVTMPTTPTTTTSTTLPGQVADPNTPVATNPGEQVYIVQANDYPLKIAKLYGISLDELAAYNGWEDPANVPGFVAGMQVRIPKGAAIPTSTLTPPTTQAPAGGATSTTKAPTSTIDATGQGSYTIKQGDTASRVAAQFDITLQQLADANGWASNQPTNAEFQVGMKLVIPAKTG